MVRVRPGLAVVLPLVTAMGCSTPGPLAGDALPLGDLRLPEGFHIQLYSDAVPGARSLARGERGTVFVGTRGQGRIYAIVDADGDQRPERVLTVAEGLDLPNGVAFHEGDLYVAEVSRVLRYRGIEGRLDDPPAPEVVHDGLPGDRHHGWRYLARGPDGWLYVGIGAPCNICERPLPYAALHRLDPATGKLEMVARGIRNTVGFTWQPGSGRLWFTDNGRDWLGDDLPPDELNVLRRPGEHFGYPHCHGNGLRDPEFGRDCAGFSPPALELGAHVAALGLRFYQGRQFPAEFRGDLLIAEHGSWNRSTPVGYRIARVHVEGDRALRAETLVSGWHGQDGAWGRPVDLLELPDGSLLISDDHAGVIYRLTWEEPN